MLCQEKSNYLLIKIADDGAGIDINSLKSKIIERALLNEEEVNRMKKRYSKLYIC